MFGTTVSHGTRIVASLALATVITLGSVGAAPGTIPEPTTTSIDGVYPAGSCHGTRPGAVWTNRAPISTVRMAGCIPAR